MVRIARQAWILSSLTLLKILTGVLRHYVSVLLTSAPKKQPAPKIRETRQLLRGSNLRGNSSTISPTAYATRKAQFTAAAKDGTLLAEPENRGKPPPNPITDPAAMEGMMGMMKGNVAMMVSQTLIMGWINAFFSGFVISKSSFLNDRDYLFGKSVTPCVDLFDVGYTVFLGAKRLHKSIMLPKFLQ